MSAASPVVMTIAGSDSGGGAGIQADLKAFTALKTFGTSAITALTAQNTMGVRAIEPVSLAMMGAQLDALFDDFEITAIKIGMLGTVDLLTCVSERLQARATCDVILDPVMASTSGHALALDMLATALWQHMLTHVALVTPNLSEAEALLGEAIKPNVSAMKAAAQCLQARGIQRVLLKGGHLPNGPALDVFVDASGEVHVLRSPRIETSNTHGTGCVLSAAITALRAQHMPWLEAITQAKRFLSEALEAGRHTRIAHGHGTCLLNVPRNVLL